MDADLLLYNAAKDCMEADIERRLAVSRADKSRNAVHRHRDRIKALLKRLDKKQAAIERFQHLAMLRRNRFVSCKRQFAACNAELSELRRRMIILGGKYGATKEKSDRHGRILGKMKGKRQSRRRHIRRLQAELAAAKEKL